MMRRSTELSPSAKKGKTTNGFADNAVFDEEMELDEQTQDREGWDADGMDTEETETTTKSNQLLTEAVQYGQQLRMDYPTDENGGDKRLLDDIFSLVCYPDPKRSVHGHYLDPAGRIVVAEELNSAILGTTTSLFLCAYTNMDSLTWQILISGSGAAVPTNGSTCQ